MLVTGGVKCLLSLQRREGFPECCVLVPGFPAFTQSHTSPTHLRGHPEEVLVVFHLQVHVQVPRVVDSVEERGHVEYLRNKPSISVLE